MTLKTLDGRDAKHRVQGWVNDCLKPRLSPKAVKHVRDVLRSTLRFGIENGQLARDATKGVRLPDIPNGYRFSILEDEEFRTFQEVANDHPWRAAYVLMVTRGLRPQELCEMLWQDIDFSRGTLMLQHKLIRVRPKRDKQGAIIEPAHFAVRDTLKTPESTQRMQLTEPELAVLKARRLRQKEERIKAGARWKGTTLGDFVFTTATGAPVHHGLFYKQFRKLLKAAGITRHVRPYDFRHTGITRVVERHGMKAGQEFARHSQYSTTADIYAHVRQPQRKAVAEDMGSLVVV